jgi:hypothetical protein
MGDRVVAWLLGRHASQVLGERHTPSGVGARNAMHTMSQCHCLRHSQYVEQHVSLIFPRRLSVLLVKRERWYLPDTPNSVVMSDCSREYILQVMWLSRPANFKRGGGRVVRDVRETRLQYEMH